MKPKLAMPFVLCLFALSSSAGDGSSESPSNGGDHPDQIAAEVGALIQSRMPEIMAQAQSIVDGMSDKTREALWRAIEHHEEAEERVEAAERRLRQLASSSEEAARVGAEAEALIRERWPEIMERARSIAGSMSDKQREAFFDAVLRAQTASDREEASRKALDALFGDRGDVGFSPLCDGGGDNLACTFRRAWAASFRTRCESQTVIRNKKRLMECSGYVGSGEDRCLLDCEANRKSDLVLCAVGELSIIQACCS